MSLKIISVEKVLPSVRDVALLKQQQSILISRILVDNIPCFKPFAKYVTRHMPHQHADVMSKATVWVSYFYINIFILFYW